ncbi:hypothetical protein BJV77DRAFT_980364 [Russula vinacea]|nr:hypothetical protein BJV77DRAFT_980364 [Russula vinacea]
MRHCQSCSNLVERLMRAVGLVVPGLLALSCTASVSGRAGGGGAYLTVISGSVCVVLFVVGNHCVLVAHVCSVG